MFGQSGTVEYSAPIENESTKSDSGCHSVFDTDSAQDFPHNVQLATKNRPKKAKAS